MRGKVLRLLVTLVVAFALPLQELAAVKAAFCHALERDAQATAAQGIDSTMSAGEGDTERAKDSHCGPSVNASIAVSTYLIVGVVSTTSTLRSTDPLAGIPADEIDHPPLAI